MKSRKSSYHALIISEFCFFRNGKVKVTDAFKANFNENILVTTIKGHPSFMVGLSNVNC